MLTAIKRIFLKTISFFQRVDHWGQFSAVLIMSMMGFCLSSCSYQWREADAGIEESDLLKLIDELGQTNGAGAIGGASANAGKFVELARQAQSSIYFVEAWSTGKSPFGPPVSVLSFADFTFLGQSADFNPFDLKRARVIFIDAKNEAGEHENALFMDYETYSQSAPSRKILISDRGSGQFRDGEFEVEFKEGSTRLIVRSDDVLDGEDDFKAVIQLNFWDFNSQGKETYLGRVPTLIGFGR